MQALLKVGLILGIFLSANVYYLLQTDINELEGIPVLADIVSYLHRLKGVLITENSHPSKATDHQSKETVSSLNKDSGTEQTNEQPHGKHSETSQEERLKNEQRHDDRTKTQEKNIDSPEPLRSDETEPDTEQNEAKQATDRVQKEDTPDKTKQTLQKPSQVKESEEQKVDEIKNGERIKEEGTTQEPHSDVSAQKESETTINLAVVACLDRVEETLVMLKSALIQTKAPLHFHIFADDANQPKFENELSTWESMKDGSAKYTVHSIQLPEDQTEKWRTLWRPCASQRLFLPKILNKIDSLLYVDTDVLFLRPLDDIWSFFNEFNATQLAGVAPEHEPKQSRSSWYNRFARHPYYGALGVNSGVMLMNLTRMREVNWIQQMVAYYKEYHLRITWGDQDLVNIFFHFFPEKLYVFPCEWNMRPDHCMYGMTCDSAEQNGASIIHGNREVFHNEKQPAFKAVYDAFLQHKFGDTLSSLVHVVEENFKNTSVTATPCGRIHQTFIKQLRKHSEQRSASLKEESTSSAKEPTTETTKVKKKSAEEDENILDLSDPEQPRIHLTVVACLDRVEETLVMLKSAVLQTKAKLRFHIFADDENMPKFKSELGQWPAISEGKVSFKVYPIQLPKENQQKWRTLWRPCASQRLFLPKVLPKVDALLYVDTDTLFLRPVDDIWKFFSSFNSTQIAAVSPEHEEGYRGGWYNRFARHPYYGSMGVNSGVMLMNLTRMREVDWVNKMEGYYDTYKFNITWGDQCLINIFFHFYPEGLFTFPCEWNTRPDHCMYGIHCQSSNTNGASIIHGNREVFHNEKQPAFKALYEGFRNHPFDGPLEDLSTAVKRNMSNGTILSMPCGRVSHIFTKQLDRQIKLRENKSPRT